MPMALERVRVPIKLIYYWRFLHFIFLVPRREIWALPEIPEKKILTGTVRTRVSTKGSTKTLRTMLTEITVV